MLQSLVVNNVCNNTRVNTRLVKVLTKGLITGLVKEEIFAQTMNIPVDEVDRDIKKDEFFTSFRRHGRCLLLSFRRGLTEVSSDELEHCFTRFYRFHR